MNQRAALSSSLATAHLAASGKASADNAVISHLQRLSSGNDFWLAQAAAEALTLR